MAKNRPMFTENYFACKDCSKRFRYFKALENHIKVNHIPTKDITDGIVTKI